jgi:predicted acetyltransferase
MPEEQGGLRASFRRLAERENGIVEGLEDDWWKYRVFGSHSEEKPGGTVASAEDVPEGYAAYRQERLGEMEGFRVACTHLVAHTRRAGLALLGYFRRFKGVGRELTWQGPPSDPLAFLIPEQELEFVSDWRFMSRILDVRAALEGRGYPEDVSGETTIGVRDPMFEENDGTFRLEAERGKLRVSRLGETPRPERAIAVGALSSLLAGYVTPSAAARAGLVDSGLPALDLLGRLFAGPAPWTPDFF